jgi:group I intron endonuclease
MSTGIYKITNLVNNKCYIGSSATNLKQRWRAHKASLNANKHWNILLQRSWNKYGADQFRFEVLEECLPEDCITREQWYLDNVLNRTIDFNISFTAGSPRGVKRSEETKRKLSLINKGRPGYAHTLESKLKISKAHKGRKMSDTQKLQLSQLFTGRQLSQAHKSAIAKGNSKDWIQRKQEGYSHCKRLFDHNNNSYNLTQLVKLFNIVTNKICRDRIRRGWNPIEAASRPKRAYAHN